MIALIPLSRFRVQYEVASGRPYSTLEQLALRAIADGARTVDDLHSLFHLHPRLLVEAVVTLTKSGWVAVGGAGSPGFVLTAIGQQAVNAQEIPNLLTIAPKTTFVLVELVTGLLIPSNDVRFVSRRELGESWDRSVRLRPTVGENELDEGQVQGFLPRQKGEWLRWIGPIDLVTRGTHWLPVDVDLKAGRVVGLPDSLDARLRPHIISACSRTQSRIDEGTSGTALPRWRRSRVSGDWEGPRIPEPLFDVSLARTDLLTNSRDHDDHLSRALATAKTNILVASAGIAINRIDRLAASIEAALKRGVNVDLLWGRHLAESGAAHPEVARLKKLAYDAEHRGVVGKLRFNAAPAYSHANTLLWDGPSAYEACVGSFSWLSEDPDAQTQAPPSARPAHITVWLHQPGLVARLARCAAALWHGAESEALASTGDRWRRVAIDLEQTVANSTGNSVAPTNCRARLLLDREHSIVLKENVRSARKRLLVASHRLGVPADSALAQKELTAPPAGVRSLFVHGTTQLSAQSIGWAESWGVALGGKLVDDPAMHANAIVSDSVCVISGYDFLSNESAQNEPRFRELGVLLEGEQPATWVAECFGL